MSKIYCNFDNYKQVITLFKIRKTNRMTSKVGSNARSCEEHRSTFQFPHKPLQCVYTYVHRAGRQSLGEREHLRVRVVLGRVAVELMVAAVELDGVELLSLQVVGTQHRGWPSRLHSRGLHVHPHIPQRVHRAPCSTQTSSYRLRPDKLKVAANDRPEEHRTTKWK